MAAFKAAIDLGADGIELDVRTCRTGEVVVFHDSMVTRLTNGRGFVKNKSLVELKSLRLNSPNPNLNEQIPTLAEVIELIDKKVILNIEIKTKGLPKDHIEDKVVEILNQYRLESKVIISSFNPIVIRRVRKINNEILTGYLIEKNFNVHNMEISLTKLSGAKAIILETSLAQEKLVAKIQELGYHSVVWTVNNPIVMKSLIEMGVDGIITDKPELMEKIKKNPKV